MQLWSSGRISLTTFKHICVCFGSFQFFDSRICRICSLFLSFDCFHWHLLVNCSFLVVFISLSVCRSLFLLVSDRLSPLATFNAILKSHTNKPYNKIGQIRKNTKTQQQMQGYHRTLRHVFCHWLKLTESMFKVRVWCDHCQILHHICLSLS